MGISLGRAFLEKTQFQATDPVEYVNLPIEQWRKILVEKPGFPEFLATHLAAVAQDHQDGVISGVTEVVEKIGGQRPQSLEEFVRRDRKSREFSTRSTAAGASPRPGFRALEAPDLS